MAHNGRPATSEYATKPSFDVLGDVSELLDRGTYSDLKIKCGDKTWDVHKNVLWLRSEYFRTMLQSRFEASRTPGPLQPWLTMQQEAQAAVIELKEDDPLYLEVLIRYLYCGKITSKSDASISDTIWYIKIHAIADKYCVNGLRARAMDFLKNIGKLDHHDGRHALMLLCDHSEHAELWDAVLPKVHANLIDVKHGNTENYRTFFSHPDNGICAWKMIEYQRKLHMMNSDAAASSSNIEAVPRLQPPTRATRAIRPKRPHLLH